MNNLLNVARDYFWSPSIWLVPGENWDFMKSTKDYTMPDIQEVYYPSIYLTLIFLCLHFVLQRFIFKPLAKWCRIPDAKHQLPPKNTLLEEVYFTTGRYPSKTTVKEISIKSKLTERQVERWLRARGSLDKASKLFKFCDCCWQLTYYLIFSCLGLYIMWDKKWLWDIRHCWYSYPHQHLTDDIWWYYMIPLGFYASSIFTHFIQPKRKDFVVLFLHHIVTIILILLSWPLNLVRVGSLVILVHECADIPLLLAKLSMYLKSEFFSNLFFIFFLLLWCVTRLGFYPFWIVRSCLFEAHVIVNAMAPMYYIFNGLLIVLLAFHVFWTYFIVRILIRRLGGNIAVHDSRSDTESDSFQSEDEDEQEKKDL